MTTFSLSRIARATRSAAYFRLGISAGSARPFGLGRRKSWQAWASENPRLSRIWARSVDVRSLAAKSLAASCGGAMVQRFGRCIRALANGKENVRGDPIAWRRRSQHLVDVARATRFLF